MIVEDLAESNDEHVKRFEQMKLSLDLDRRVHLGGQYYPPLASHSNRSENHTIDGETYPRVVPSPFQVSSQIAGAASIENEAEQHGYEFLQLALTHTQSLLKALLREIHASAYQISTDSRSRIREGIVATHLSEIRQLEARICSLRLRHYTQDFLQPQNPTDPSESDLSSVPKPLQLSASKRRSKMHDLKPRKRTKTACLSKHL